MKNTLFAFGALIAIAVSPLSLWAFGSSAVQMASDARAASMAGSYTAIANDLSALIYNPAGLAFVPVRQLSVSVEGLDQSTVSDFSGTTKNTALMRLRIGQAGFIRAIPTERGGLTLALGFQSPYTFDDCVTTEGGYSSSYGRDSIHLEFANHGELSFWSGGLGIQVVPGLGVGLTASLVSGSEHERSEYVRLINDIVLAPADSFDFADQTERTYIGYDLRGGLLYAFNDFIKAGLMISVPQMLFFWESFTEDYPHSMLASYTEKSTGTMYSAWNLTLGMQAHLPFMTIACDGHVRAPYLLSMPGEDIPENSPASQALRSASIGVEVPVGAWVVRGGYGAEDVDLFKFVRKYDNAPVVNWGTPLTIDSYRQTISGGIGFMANGGGVCIEAGYSHSWWTMSNYSKVFGLSAVEKHAQDRLSLSLSFRY